LRRMEVCNLDLLSIHWDDECIMVKGKGRVDEDEVHLPTPTLDSLREWVKYRGDEPGPLFMSFGPDHLPTGKRLGKNGLYKICKGFGVRPHGFRHTAITTALDNTAGDVVAVAAFSRHRNLEMVQVYDDKSEERGRGVAEGVAVK